MKRIRFLFKHRIALILCMFILSSNNGIINMASNKEFYAPVGAIVSIESGDIH